MAYRMHSDICAHRNNQSDSSCEKCFKDKAEELFLYGYLSLF